MPTDATPTTGTAPLIERIAEASWEHYEHGEHPAWADLDELAPNAKAWELSRAAAILAALGDGIWIEREQARETIAVTLRDMYPDDVRGTTDSGVNDIYLREADAVIAALAGEERP
jgi:hypothetical protein